MHIQPENKRYLKLCGEKITRERERRGLNQTQLAEMANIKLAMLKQIEEGITDFPFDYMFAVLKSLAMTPGEFFADFT